MFDKALAERFAMLAEQEVRKLNTFAGSVNALEIGEQLGLSKEDSRHVAFYLQNLGWTNSVDGQTTLVITPKGFDEIAKLRQPRIVRWADKHPKTLVFFVGIVTVIIAEALKHLFWSK